MHSIPLMIRYSIEEVISATKIETTNYEKTLLVNLRFQSKYHTRRKLLTASFHYSILESFREQIFDIARDFTAEIARNSVGEHDFLGNIPFILTPQST